MNLKEAFRYQNYINTLIDKTVSYLCSDSIILNTKEEHLKSKDNPDVEDEVVDKTKERTIPYSANSLVDFYDHLIDTKKILNDAIKEAKAKTDIDIDSEIANNKVRQRAADTFLYMAAKRPSELKSTGSAKKFNAEGNQVSYYYDINIVKTIDFDRNKVRALGRKYKEEADRYSSEIEKAMLEDIVSYYPEYMIGDSFDDAICSTLKIDLDDAE